MTSMTSQASTVILNELFGPLLLGRTEGARAREVVQELRAAGCRVRADFSGIEAMTPGFADEFFGRLPADEFEAGLISIEGLAPRHQPLLRLVTSRSAARRAASAA